MSGKLVTLLNGQSGDFPDGPVGRIPVFQCWGQRFDPSARTQQSQELALLGGLHLLATCGLDIGPLLQSANGYLPCIPACSRRKPGSAGEDTCPLVSCGEWRRLLAWPLPLQASLCSHRGLFSSKLQHCVWGRLFQAV